MVCLPNSWKTRIVYSQSIVCKTDDACANFPLLGKPELDPDSEVANMTCYKAGETVFENHQMCDVTSKFSCLLLVRTLIPKAQTARFWTNSTDGNRKSLSVVIEKPRRVNSNSGLHRSNHSTAVSRSVSQS